MKKKRETITLGHRDCASSHLPCTNGIICLRRRIVSKPHIYIADWMIECIDISHLSIPIHSTWGMDPDPSSDQCKSLRSFKVYWMVRLLSGYDLMVERRKLSSIQTSLHNHEDMSVGVSLEICEWWTNNFAKQQIQVFIAGTNIVFGYRPLSVVKPLAHFQI